MPSSTATCAERSRQDSIPEGGKGTYILVIENTEDRLIDTGAPGRRHFPEGYYLYVGSALGPGGIHARVNRHFRKTKKRHWHIDALTLAMNVREAWICGSGERLECRWNTLLAGSHDAYPAEGFGSTDCTCHSHLHYFKNRPHALDFGKTAGIPVQIMKNS